MDLDEIDNLLEESLKKESFTAKRGKSANPFSKKDDFTPFEEFDWNDTKPAAKPGPVN